MGKFQSTPILYVVGTIGTISNQKKNYSMIYY